MYFVFKNRQDKFEIELLKKHLSKGDIVLDIGANIGFYSRILSEIVGNTGKIHCFEPDKINYERLQINCADLQNVILNQKAVGPKTEKLKIYTSKTLNVDHRTYKPDEFDEVFEIEAVNIDEYLGNINQVNFIKMDIQGFEMSAVKGMEKTLDSNAEIKLISEFWPYGLKKAGSSAMDYYNFLIQKKFHCYMIEGEKLTKITEAMVNKLQNMSEEHYYNIFATRKEL